MSILLMVGGLYLGWAVLLFAAQRGMMFPGAAMSSPGVAENRPPSDVEQVWLDVSGDRVEAWFMASRYPPPAATVIVAHGNAELIDHGMWEARELRELGLSVLLVEYPGYGRSEGRPSRSSIGETLLTAYDWLLTREDVDPKRIVGMGRSLGSGAVTDLAMERSLGALILISPFTSVGAFAKRYLLPAFLARDRFDNLAVLRRWEGPVLLMHGLRDRVIPHSHSERLLRASTAAQLVSLDCGHNDCPPDPEAYFETLGAFLVRAGVIVPEN